MRVDAKRTVGLNLISTDSWEGWQSVPTGDAQECLNKQPKTEESNVTRRDRSARAQAEGAIVKREVEPWFV